jgi:hypothetical protein
VFEYWLKLAFQVPFSRGEQLKNGFVGGCRYGKANGKTGKAGVAGNPMTLQSSNHMGKRAKTSKTEGREQRGTEQI